MEHLPYSVLKDRLKESYERVPEGYYEHYKNRDLYKVIGHTILERTGEVFVAYTPCHIKGVVWSRPLSEWTEIVEHDGRDTERYTELGTARPHLLDRTPIDFHQDIPEAS